MSDKMQDWLSGRPDKKDEYAEEMEGRRLAFEKGIPDDMQAEIDAYRTSLDSPYNRVCRARHIDLALVRDCLYQMGLTGDPLPAYLVDVLTSDINLLMSNREGHVLKCGKNPTTHPDDVYWRSCVIEYVTYSKARGLDENPIKTIKEELGIGKSTYYEWKQTTGVLDWVEGFDDDEAKKWLRDLWGRLLKHFNPE